MPGKEPRLGILDGLDESAILGKLSCRCLENWVRSLLLSFKVLLLNARVVLLDSQDGLGTLFGR
jgi:hypothetical protein